VLLNIVLGFIEGLEFFEMSECFATSAKLVVDLELATNKWKILERLEVRKVFPGVLLMVSQEGLLKRCLACLL
jgi:hypothetical protein